MKTLNQKPSSCLLGLASLLAVLFTAPAFGAPSVEVVQTVPLETTFAISGIRATDQVWLEMIGRAKETLDLEQFYINNQSGESLDPVLSAVRAAAARGVKVRLIVDSKFYQNYSSEPNQLGQVDNIEVKVIDYSKHGGIQHSKYFIVDQSEVFEGSANFDWLALSHIHEVGLRLNDSKIASDLESIFEKDWAMADSLPNNKTVATLKSPLKPTIKNLASLSGYQLVASPASENPEGISDSLTAIVKQMDLAEHSLKIQVYEYSTKLYKSKTRFQTLDNAIRKAATRGVSVQLLVDAVSMKSGGADLKALAALSNISVKTVKVPEWSGGHLDYARLIHSKYLTVDNTSAWVGTENWTGDYFNNSRNVGVIVNASDTTEKLTRIFDQVWNSNYTTSL